MIHTVRLIPTVASTVRNHISIRFTTTAITVIIIEIIIVIIIMVL